MIPLAWLLIIWIIGVGIFLLLALLTITLALRFGISGLRTFLFCGLFAFTSFVVIALVGTYALGVDWTQTLSFAGQRPNDTLFFP